MFDTIDLPARIMSYRDAGVEKTEAVRMAKLDMQDASAKVLEEDYANPVSVEIAELSQEPLETAQDVIDTEKYESAVELRAVVGACAEHGMGMSDVHYRLASLLQNNLNCRHIGEKVMISMESVHASQISERDLMLHFEDSVGETLKKLWEKIRNSFINTFNKLKSWLIKAFDGTQRLGNKAKAIRTTAESKQGTVNNQSFQMSGVKTLSLNGKVPDPIQLTSVIGNMSVITQNILGNTAEYYNKLTDKMSDAVKGLTEQAVSQMPAVETTDPKNPQAPKTVNTNTTTGSDDFSVSADKNAVLKSMTAEIKAIQDSFNKILEKWDGAASDERFADLAKDTAIAKEFLKTSVVLPGDKMFVVTVPAADSVSTAQGLSALKLAVGGTVETIAPKPRELEDSGTFKTLSVSQITTICDNVMEACKAGLDYKLLFAQRDGAFKKLGDQLDKTVNESDKLQGQALTFVKANVSAATTIFGKINRMESGWLRYTMGAMTKAVDYCQGSLGQIT